MENLSGNLLDMAEGGKFDVIVHGCNCFHAMGSGIAKQIAERYPRAQEADFITPKGDREKLGRFSFVSVEGKVKNTFLIVNAYTQYRWSGKVDVFEYEKFDEFLLRFSEFLMSLYAFKNRHILVGFPKIGCGYAKGNEQRILSSLQNFSDSIEPWGKVSLVTYAKTNP